MKIKINDSIFEIADIFSKGNQFRLMSSSKVGSQLIKAVSEGAVINILDDTDNIIKTIEGKFTRPYTVDEPNSQTVVFNVEDNAAGNIMEVNKQITDLKSAMSEIYAVIGGLVNKEVTTLNDIPEKIREKIIAIIGK